MTTLDDAQNLHGRTYSVTIRPRADHFKKEWQQCLVIAFSKASYVIALETGDPDGAGEPNHLQCVFIMNTRTDNLRRKVKTALGWEPEDDMEKRCWLKISKHDDPLYAIGYCQKEGRYKSNLPPECLSQGVDVYEEKPRPSASWKCKGINGLLDFAKVWWEQEQAESTYVSWRDYSSGGVVSRSYPKLKTVCVMMHSKGLIPFSLARKIRKDDEIFWKAMMEKMTASEINLEIE